VMNRMINVACRQETRICISCCSD